MLVGATGFLCQFGNCDFGSITTTSTVTLDGGELIASLVQSAIITPLDEWLTSTVIGAFGSDNE